VIIKSDPRDIAAALAGAIGWGGNNRGATADTAAGGGKGQAGEASGQRFGAEKVKRQQQNWKPRNIAAKTKEQVGVAP
jgi:hypothetical protein